MLTFSLSSLQNPFVSMLAGWSGMSQSRAWMCWMRDRRSQVYMSCVLPCGQTIRNCFLSECVCWRWSVWALIESMSVSSRTHDLRGGGRGGGLGNSLDHVSLAALLVQLCKQSIQATWDHKWVSFTVISGAVVNNKSHNCELIDYSDQVGWGQQGS